MSRRVFFHIGVPKAGTTFVQTMMWRHRAQLRDQGLHYPGSKRLDHYHAAHDLRHPGAGRHGGAWPRVVREVAAWPGRSLITHEFFGMCTADQARVAVAALAPARVDVVVTARDYVRQFPAIWQEAVKMGSALSLDAFMDRAMARELRGAWSWQSQDLPRILRRWASAVPQARVHLVTVPPAGAARDVLWRRWCEVLELDPSAFDITAAFGNESLGAAQAAFLQRIDPCLDGSLQDKASRHRWVRQYLGHEVLGAQDGERFGLRPHHAERLRHEAEVAVERLRKRRYHVVGDLDDLLPGAGRTPSTHPAEVTERELLEVAGRAVDAMVRDVRALTADKERRAVAADRRPRPVRAMRVLLGRDGTG